MIDDRIVIVKKILSGNPFGTRSWIYLENVSYFYNDIQVYTKDLGISGNIAYIDDQPIDTGTYSILPKYIFVVNEPGIIEEVIDTNTSEVLSKGYEYKVPRISNTVNEYYLTDTTKLINYEIEPGKYVFAAKFSDLTIYQSTEINTNQAYLFPFGYWDDNITWYDSLIWWDGE